MSQRTYAEQLREDILAFLQLAPAGTFVSIEDLYEAFDGHSAGAIAIQVHRLSVSGFLESLDGSAGIPQLRYRPTFEARPNNSREYPWGVFTRSGPPLCVTKSEFHSRLIADALSRR